MRACDRELGQKVWRVDADGSHGDLKCHCDELALRLESQDVNVGCTFDGVA